MAVGRGYGANTTQLMTAIGMAETQFGAARPGEKALWKDPSINPLQLSNGRANMDLWHNVNGALNEVTRSCGRVITIRPVRTKDSAGHIAKITLMRWKTFKASQTQSRKRFVEMHKYTICKCMLTIAIQMLSLFVLVGIVVGQATDGAKGKVASASEIKTFPVPDPMVYDWAVENHRTIWRAKITLNGSMHVKLLEKPKSIENNDSILEIHVSGKHPRTFEIGRLLKCPELRFVHAALIHTDSTRGMLVLEYEGGSIGAREGFAVVRFDEHSATVHVLPLTDFGKVVVFRGNQGIAEIWSGDDCLSASPDSGGCEYITRMCTWRAEGYSCDQPKRMEGVFNQNDISDPGIEIRP